MNQKRVSVIMLVVVLMWLALNSFYVSDAGENTVLMRFGEVSAQQNKPGWYFKLPLIEQAIAVDSRMRITTLPKLNVSVAVAHSDDDMPTQLNANVYVAWRVSDAGSYANKVGIGKLASNGDQGALPGAVIDQVAAALSTQLAGHQLSDVLTTNRRKQFNALLAALNGEQAKAYGIQLEALDLIGLSWPKADRAAIRAKMKADIAAKARRVETRGMAKVKEIEADYNAKAASLLADAKRQAAQMRAQGNQKAAKIYAASYSKNPEFYRFFRSLEAYRASFGEKDFLVLTPDSDFFHYFKQADGE